MKNRKNDFLIQTLLSQIRSFPQTHSDSIHSNGRMSVCWCWADVVICRNHFPHDCCCCWCYLLVFSLLITFSVELEKNIKTHVDKLGLHDINKILTFYVYDDDEYCYYYYYNYIYVLCLNLTTGNVQKDIK